MKSYLYLKKIIRFLKIYGILRTISKITGRTNIFHLRFLFKAAYIKKNKYVSVIGCGQFGFSTISYYIQKKNGNIFLDCYDINFDNSKKCQKFWGYKFQESFEDLLNNPNCKLVYIASDHYTHTYYGIKAIENNKDIFIEKPLSVNKNQFRDLLTSINNTNQKVYAGYNRPFSQAIMNFIKRINPTTLSPFTIDCFIYAHNLDKNHWYRQPEQGTRINGNVGHWVDLMTHILSKKKAFPLEYDIQIAYSNINESDDNISINIVSEQNDLTSITITSYSEPFEGINETINIHHKYMHLKIDDFRKSILWISDKKIKRNYFPKDVGHEKSILQPFHNLKRDFNEVKYSTLMTLFIADMVKNKETHKHLNINDELTKLFEI